MAEGRRVKKIKRQKRRKRAVIVLKRIIKIVAVLLLIGVVTAAVVVNVFKVKEVEYAGNTWNDDATIEAYLFNKPYFRNTIVFALRDKYLKKTEIPYVETYEVKIKWPGKITVNVYEKKIMGYIKTENGNMYFDKDGIVVDCSEELLSMVPEIKGILPENIELHQKMNMPSDVVLSAVVEIKQQLDKYHLEADAIEFDRDYNIVMKAGDIKIKLGQAEYLTEKVFEYSRICKKLSNLKGTLNLEACDGTSKNYPFTPSQ